MTALLVELLDESRQRGFLGPGPVEDHIAHAQAFACVDIGSPARALDLGAGGGLPGLVLAATRWPDTSWCLLDAQQRRTAFLQSAVDRLGLADRVQVVHGRAETFGRAATERGTYDLVVARSFGTPAVVAECAGPVLRLGGSLVVSEPPDASASARWPTEAIAVLGFDPAHPVNVDGTQGDSVHLVHLQRVAACPDRYPRREGLPAKRPLF